MDELRMKNYFQCEFSQSNATATNIKFTNWKLFVVNVCSFLLAVADLI